jgi:guanylate kinase
LIPLSAWQRGGRISPPLYKVERGQGVSTCNKDMSGKLIIISGPSGTGKTSIVKHLLDSGLNLAFSVSATTRSPRANEINGTDYYFLHPDEFRRRVDAGEFAEWEEVYENIRYGTLKSEIERIWSKGCHVLFDVDVKGGINLKKMYGNKALALFIMPPSVEDLERRLVLRASETPEKIRMRVMKAEAEIKLSNQFDSIIINKVLDTAREEVLTMVSSFLSK